MSSARKDFWESTKRFPIGCFCPSKYGIKGCIPEPVNRVVGSFSGTKEEEGITLCPLFSKNSRYFFLTSSELIVIVYCVCEENKRTRSHKATRAQGLSRHSLVRAEPTQHPPKPSPTPTPPILLPCGYCVGPLGLPRKGCLSKILYGNN